MSNGTSATFAARLAATVAAACILSLPEASAARHFRWASQGDISTLDPHAMNESFNSQQNGLVYENLTHRDKDYRVIPGLAISWENTSPRTWIVHLRKAVRFQDGTPFTADDVVFSHDRARLSGTGYKTLANLAGTVRRIDDHAVEFTTPTANPLFPEVIGSIGIMSKAWAEKHNSVRPQDFRAKEVNYASRNAMGTGPFILVSYEPGVKTVHRKNPHWWGIPEGHFEGNVETVEYRPIAHAATRMAALQSGELDFVLDPPVQDVPKLRAEGALKVWEGEEIRVMFVGLDMTRGELLYSDVRGRNPFKDIRVRKALYQAIDIEAIRTQVMRGMARVTGVLLHDPKGSGLPPELDRRLPHDPDAARRLLAEAGFPGGFGFTLNCPNDRYINDAKICSALAAMWARIGLNVRVETLPRAQYFQKVGKQDTSAFLVGWGAGSSDPLFMLKSMFHSRDGMAGDLNFGDFRDPRLDRLIVALEGEMDLARRGPMVEEAITIIRDEVLALPLHRQAIVWASRPHVSVVLRPNNSMVPQWVTLK